MNYKYYLKHPILYGAGDAPPPPYSPPPPEEPVIDDLEARLANLRTTYSAHDAPPPPPPPEEPVIDDLEARLAMLQNETEIVDRDIYYVQREMDLIVNNYRDPVALNIVRSEVENLLIYMINNRIIDLNEEDSILYRAEQLLRRLSEDESYNMEDDPYLHRVVNDYLEIYLELVNERRSEYIMNVLARAGVPYDRLLPGEPQAFYEAALTHLINDVEELEEEELDSNDMENTILELFDEYTHNYFADRTPL